MCACNFSLGAEVVFFFVFFFTVGCASQGLPQQLSKWNSHQFSSS